MYQLTIYYPHGKKSRVTNSHKTIIMDMVDDLKSRYGLACNVSWQGYRTCEVRLTGPSKTDSMARRMLVLVVLCGLLSSLMTSCSVSMIPVSNKHCLWSSDKAARSNFNSPKKASGFHMTTRGHQPKLAR